MMFSYIDESDYDPGKVIVALNKECAGTIDLADFSSLEFDGILVERIELLFHEQDLHDDSNIGAIILISLQFRDKNAIINAIERLMSNPCVVFAEPDFYVDMHIIPNDPYYDYLWGIKDIQSPSAWNYTTGSGSVVVGVIDSGIEHNHPDLRGNMWSIPFRAGLYGWDFYNNIGNPTDRTGHGTHVAGTIGAVGNNFIGVTGVCWNVKMASLKIGNDFFDVASVVKSIDFANEYDIPILNGSWGMRQFSNALKYAIDHYNGLFIASAGNSSSNNDRFPIYPASYDSSNIISVAATDMRGRLAPFSNYGVTSVDIAAPGSDIFSTSLGGYSVMSGTSMSAPHIAGAAALLKSYIPGLSTWELKNIILSSADKQPQLRGSIATEGTLNINRMMRMAADLNNVR